MDWQSIVLSVIGIVLTALVSWATERLIALINSKISNAKYAKYLTDAVDVVTRAVKTTYQTYVEALKKDPGNAFTAEAQKEALAKACELVREQLGADVQKYIEENFGGFEQWMKNAIESVIYDLKNTYGKGA